VRFCQDGVEAVLRPRSVRAVIDVESNKRIDVGDVVKAFWAPDKSFYEAEVLEISGKDELGSVAVTRHVYVSHTEIFGINVHWRCQFDADDRDSLLRKANIPAPDPKKTNKRQRRNDPNPGETWIFLQVMSLS